MQTRAPIEEARAYYWHIEDACAAFERMSERQREQLHSLIESGQDITSPQASANVPERNDKATRDYASAIKAANSVYTNATAAGRAEIDRFAQIIRKWKNHSPTLTAFFSVFCDAIREYWSGSTTDRESLSAPKAEQTPNAKKVIERMNAAKKAYQSLTKEDKEEADEYLQYFEEWHQPQA